MMVEMRNYPGTYKLECLNTWFPIYRGLWCLLICRRYGHWVQVLSLDNFTTLSLCLHCPLENMCFPFLSATTMVVAHCQESIPAVMDSYLSGIRSQNKFFCWSWSWYSHGHSGRKSMSTVAKYLFSLLCKPFGKDLKLWFWPLQQLSTCPQANPRFITLQSFFFREEKRYMEKEHHEYMLFESIKIF